MLSSAMMTTGNTTHSPEDGMFTPGGLGQSVDPGMKGGEEPLDPLELTLASFGGHGSSKDPSAGGSASAGGGGGFGVASSDGGGGIGRPARFHTPQASRMSLAAQAAVAAVDRERALDRAQREGLGTLGGGAPGSGPMHPRLNGSQQQQEPLLRHSSLQQSTLVSALVSIPAPGASSGTPPASGAPLLEYPTRSSAPQLQLPSGAQSPLPVTATGLQSSEIASTSCDMPEKTSNHSSVTPAKRFSQTGLVDGSLSLLPLGSVDIQAKGWVWVVMFNWRP